MISDLPNGHFLKQIQFYFNNTINLCHLTQRIISCYRQNGDHIVTIDSATSLHPVYILISGHTAINRYHKVKDTTILCL